MKRIISHITCFIALALCALWVTAVYAKAETGGIESVIPVRVVADGSGMKYTIVLESAETGTREEICLPEGKEGTFTVTHYSPGTYVYTITQKEPDQQLITPDRAQYRAYVCITQNDDLRLFSSVSLQKNSSGSMSEKADTAAFSNTYRKPDDNTADASSPKTGDETGVWQLIFLSAGALTAIIIFAGARRRIHTDA